MGHRIGGSGIGFALVVDDQVVVGGFSSRNSGVGEVGHPHQEVVDFPADIFQFFIQFF